MYRQSNCPCSIKHAAEFEVSHKYCRYITYWVTNVLSVHSIIYSPSDACLLLEFFVLFSWKASHRSSVLMKTRNYSVCLAHGSNHIWLSNSLNCYLLLRVIHTNRVETRWPSIQYAFLTITCVFTNMQLLLPVRHTASINQYAEIFKCA